MATLLLPLLDYELKMRGLAAPWLVSNFRTTWLSQIAPLPRMIINYAGHVSL